MAVAASSESFNFAILPIPLRIRLLNPEWVNVE
jgi:hypothetical protein